MRLLLRVLIALALGYAIGWAAGFRVASVEPTGAALQRVNV